MDRFKATKISSILGIVGNIFLLIIKGIIGYITSSQSMIADAFNSAGDIFSSCMTFIGNKISSKEADEDHHLGHGKAEYIYSLLISITMIVLSVTVIKNAIMTLINKEYFEYSIWLIIICLITIITKFCLFLFTNKLYKKHNNILIKANSIDHRNDCFITITTLISIILSNMGLYFVDAIVGILISLWIFYTAIKKEDCPMDNPPFANQKSLLLLFNNNFACSYYVIDSLNFYEVVTFFKVCNIDSSVILVCIV